MIAFHGDRALQQDLYQRVSRHIADETLQFGNTSWDGTAGSPLGVSAHSTDVEIYADRFGYPLPLAALLDPMTALLAPDPDGHQLVLDWILAVEPGADMLSVPTRLMQNMLKSAQTASKAAELKDQLMRLHDRDMESDPPTRAEWSDLRKAISTMREQTSEAMLYSSLSLLEAGCWPAGRGYTPLSSTFAACIDLVAILPDADWGEAEEKQRDEFFMALEAKLKPQWEAGEKVDFFALFQEGLPDLAARFQSFSDRYAQRIAQRAQEVAQLCVSSLRRASGPVALSSS